MAIKAMVGAAAAVLLAATAASAETVRFAVTDIAGLEDLQREFGGFRDTLARLTGLDIDFVPVNSRTAAVEAMRADQVDFVLTGPAEYVVFHQVTDAEVVIGWQRPDYFAQIVTLADGPYRDVDSLRGQTVTFGEVGSTSQHLGPAQVLADFGLVYGQDYEPAIISRNVAVEALIRGDVAAVGMNFTHLGRIREAFPDVAFTVVARGRDLPNDILIASPGVPDEIVEAVRTAFIDHQDSLLEAVLQGEDNQKYGGGSFLANISDADYDYVRSMYRTIGIADFSQFVGN
ncbi:MAG: PhnD/SsuA/transferrin family substrate-binding protein [Rhodospirillaceae bacterium]|nr:PhnD/SsuA/transferrin family substrate-binding protein [Rhodospirillaceae bacterium]